MRVERENLARRLPAAAQTDAGPLTRRRRRGRPAALAAACIGIGLGAWLPGPALERALAPEPGEGASAALVAGRDFASSRPPGAPAAAALRIFDSRSNHGPSAGFAGGLVNLGPAYRPESIRAALETMPVAGSFGFYAAQRADGRYCLVAQDAHGNGDAVCGTVDEIVRHGLSLRATVTGTAVAGSAQPKLFDLDIDWFPTGSIGARAVPHGSTPTPHTSPCETVRRARCGSAAAR